MQAEGEFFVASGDLVPMSENGEPARRAGLTTPLVNGEPLATPLDSDACYRALLARDARFDGLFFVGVTTTGIYCRPVCRARLPGRARCQFFPSAAVAEREGFRACFRCRPSSRRGEGASTRHRRSSPPPWRGSKKGP